jgi:hypothetical protein
MKVGDAVNVYRAVRQSGHSWWRGLRCVNKVRRGSWAAADAGELRAQLKLVAQALERNQ